MTEPDLDAILAEINKLAKPPLLEPGDVTVGALMEEWHLSNGATMQRAKKFLVDSGLYESLKVFDPERGHYYRVYRKR